MYFDKRGVITYEQYQELKRGAWSARDLDERFRILETLHLWRFRSFVCDVIHLLMFPPSLRKGFPSESKPDYGRNECCPRADMSGLEDIFRKFEEGAPAQVWNDPPFDMCDDTPSF